MAVDMEPVRISVAGKVEPLHRLAARVAFQLVLKCPTNQLGDATVWDAIGRQVHHD